jgi:hypothetical protein
MLAGTHQSELAGCAHAMVTKRFSLCFQALASWHSVAMKAGTAHAIRSSEQMLKRDPKPLIQPSLNLYGETEMHTLMIKDLSASLELDRKAMTAVRGGTDDQAIGTSQSNVQHMVAAANVGNGSIFRGPSTIQSDNTFTQSAYNYNDATNVSAFGLFGLGFGRVGL